MPRVSLFAVYAFLGHAFLGSVFLSPAPGLASTHPQDVTLKAGQYSLHGCVWLPDTPGPYPVIIYNHGSDKNPPPCGPPDIARFYVQHGYAFFAFQRHGHGASPGDYILDLQRKVVVLNALNRSSTMREVIALHEMYNKDVEGGVVWVKQQKWANLKRIAMVGVSYGGIQTLLAAEKGLGIRAFIAFAPAAQSWNATLGDRLIKAVKQSHSPVFIIQAKNDYGLEPCQLFAQQLKPPSRTRIYPPFGQNPQQAHYWFGTRAAGAAIWGPDVLAFLSAVMS